MGYGLAAVSLQTRERPKIPLSDGKKVCAGMPSRREDENRICVKPAQIQSITIISASQTQWQNGGGVSLRRSVYLAYVNDHVLSASKHDACENDASKLINSVRGTQWEIDA